MNNKSLKIFDNQYFPCVNWFKNSINETHININGFERYKKRSFFNRCGVAGSTGRIFLTVPVEGGRNASQKLQFRNVKISYAENWQKLHRKTLQSCYGSSPFFEFYKDDLNAVLEKKFTFLFDLNLAIIHKLFFYLTGKQYDISVVNDYQDRFFSIGYFPHDYDVAEQAPIYNQLFADRQHFQPNLSILDLLFMEGNNSINILKSTFCRY